MNKDRVRLCREFDPVDPRTVEIIRDRVIPEMEGWIASYEAAAKDMHGCGNMDCAKRCWEEAHKFRDAIKLARSRIAESEAKSKSPLDRGIDRCILACRNVYLGDHRNVLVLRDAVIPWLELQAAEATPARAGQIRDAVAAARERLTRINKGNINPGEGR